MFLHSIGRYPVIAETRVGRLTAVYQVRHPVSNQTLALKTISHRAEGPQRSLAIATLRREADVRAEVEHPAIVPLYDLAPHDDAWLVVGPWLSGGTLLQRWPNRPPTNVVLDIAQEIGSALDALHRKGWTHGDISPNNIMFDYDARPKLTDLGSAIPVGSRRVFSPYALNQDLSTRWPITRLTAAPESLHGEAIDGRADLYAFGAIVYFLLVGDYPFVADDAEALRDKHAFAPVPIPSERCTLLSPAVDEVLIRILAKRPEHRYESGVAFAEALRGALLDSADPHTRPSRVLPTRRATQVFLNGDNAQQRTQKTLSTFAASLNDEEREVFHAALRALRQKDAASRAQAGVMLRSMVAPLAALRAAEDLGILRVLAEGAKTTAELAQVCDLPEDNTERLCRFLKADQRLGLMEGRWTLLPPLSATHAPGWQTPADMRLVASTQIQWAQLAAWVQTGKPPIAMDAKEDGEDYVESVRTLGDNASEQANELALTLQKRAFIQNQRTILDVGAGSAVWSLALAKTLPYAIVTALDRPKVLEVAKTRAKEYGIEDRLRTIAGNWQSFELGSEEFDLIVLAKVCHLESAIGLEQLFQRLGPMLSEAGRLLVIDTIPEHSVDASLDVLRYDISLALRTIRGRIHDQVAYERALASAGLEMCDLWSLGTDGRKLCALVARRACDPAPA